MGDENFSVNWMDRLSRDLLDSLTLFNKAAIEFRNENGLQPQEIDWILTFIASYVENEDNRFVISEDLLETEQVTIAVDDETDIDDIVGEPKIGRAHV